MRSANTKSFIFAGRDVFTCKAACGLDRTLRLRSRSWEVALGSESLKNLEAIPTEGVCAFGGVVARKLQGYGLSRDPESQNKQIAPGFGAHEVFGYVQSGHDPKTAAGRPVDVFVGLALDVFLP